MHPVRHSETSHVKWKTKNLLDQSLDQILVEEAQQLAMDSLATFSGSLLLRLGISHAEAGAVTTNNSNTDKFEKITDKTFKHLIKAVKGHDAYVPCQLNLATYMPLIIIIILYACMHICA